MRKARKSKSIIFVLGFLVCIIIFLSISNVYLFLKSGERKRFEKSGENIVQVENRSKVEVDTKGFIKAKISVDNIFGDKAQISLNAGCYVIRATTDACVGEAIMKGLEKKVDFRPSVYDVIVDSFRLLNIDVLALRIVDVRNNTFIGELILQQNERVLFLDIRPSDGSAIAVRVNAPIYINESIAEKYGEKIC